MSIYNPAPIIEFDNVSKAFVQAHGQMLIRSHLARLLQSRSAPNQRFYALKHVSFHVNRGDSLAVIGPNGAGKSTLLSMVAGLARPDEGRVAVKGMVAALLELGAGFHYDLTGAENVRLNASLLGLTKKRTAQIFDEIVEFSGIGDFIHEPLRTYSSGMVLRLAFSVAVNTDPEILLIDEVMVVGDQAFQKKCVEKIQSFREQGKTLICVSHATSVVMALCNRAIWLDHGELVMSGTASEIVDAYEGKRATVKV